MATETGKKTPAPKGSRKKTTKEMTKDKGVSKTTRVPATSIAGSPTPIAGSPLLSDSMMPYKFEPYSTSKNEEYMNDKQLKHFRNILETWKKELMKEVDNTISEMKGASVLADPNDRATQEEAFNLELRTRDRERKLIRKIEEALQLIDAKEYGYCESCGVEIGIRRLEARPTAFLCIDCKTLDEIRERNVQ